MSDTLPETIGKYPILRELGRGATSRVYLGRDPFASRNVAIKVIYVDGNADAGMQRRFRKVFLNEASLAGRLVHPHIITIYDAVIAEEYSYIVMEYVEGRTLEYYAETEPLLPVEKVVEIIFKCTLALDFAQRHGVIHCDIKPANILISERQDVKISDFGAALYHNAEHTQLRGIGSPAYMSPEQMQEQELTHSTDIYSLGVVTYQLLTGKLPLTATNKGSMIYQVLNIDPRPPSTHRRDLVPKLDEIVMRAMAKRSGDRYQNWSDFSRDLVSVYRVLEMPAGSISDGEKFNTVRSLSFFRDFRDVEVWETLRITAWQKLSAETVIIREGDTGDAFYVLTAGEVKVTKTGRLLNILHPGDCFGEMLYFGDENARRTTTITAVSSITVIEIKADALRQASDALQKQFNKAFMRLLIDRLTLANERLARMQ
jgi:eukaryotic-like serine/threonine-protein kinase